MKMLPKYKRWLSGVGIFLAILILLDARIQAKATQTSSPGFAVEVSDPVYPSLSPAVRDLPPYQVPDIKLDLEINPRQNATGNVYTGPGGLLGGIDSLLAIQAAVPPAAPDGFTTPIFNFDGEGYQFLNPPDTVGDVGLDHYIQMVNATVVSIYDKATANLVSQFSLTSLGGCSTGSGDPVVLYDEQADRWLLSEFGSGSSLCVFVSQTADPTGAYYSYQFSTPSFPDYPKYGVWPDAYYISTNESNPAAYALDRTKMLAGLPATSQRFTATDLTGFGFQALTPSDLDGDTLPPAGSPNYFMRHRDTEAHGNGNCAVSAGQDCLEIWAFHADFVTPANSTFTEIADITIADIDSELCGFFAFACFPQPGTGTTLDPLREVIMFRLVYRNFGSHEVLLGNLVTDVDGTDHGGIRWFELRKQGAGAWSLFQEGTYAPDIHHRWMGAIAMDGDGNIALGYNVSSTTQFPSLRYVGRLASDPLGTMPQGEAVLINGTASNGSNRYGDYAAMSVDPEDDCTFWFTGEYNATSSWSTRVGAFKFDECGTPDFTLSVTPDSQAVCTPDDAVFNVNVGQVQGYTDPVTLSATGNPAGTTTAFSTNPITPPGTSDLTIGNTGAASAGSYNMNVVGVAATSTHTATVTLDVYTAAPGAPTLTSPANGASGVALQPTFQWTAVAQAADYFIEIATDAAFTNVVDSATVTTNSYTPAVALNGSTLYYWRVTASNTCGDGAVSATFSFTTLALLCRAPALVIPDNTTVTDNFVVGNDGALLDLNVSINATHSWVGDTTFTLTHQDTGTSVTMIDRPGYTGTGFGCSSDNIGALMDDEGGDGPVESQCAATPPALFGSPTPNNPLSAFDGEDLSGTWIMSVSDGAGGDTGVLNEWCLEPSVEPTTAPSIVVAPNSLSSTQVPETVITQTLTISNVGDADLNWVIAEDNQGQPPVCSAPSDIPWVSVTPPSGTTAPASSDAVAVALDSTGLSDGVYTGTLCLTSDDALNPLVSVPLTLTVETPPPPIYGVALSADQAVAGDAGTTVSYVVTLTNTGNTTDTFDLTAASVWTTTLSAPSLTIGAGATVTFTVAVEVPGNAANGDVEVTTITATSQNEASATDSVNLTTTAVVPPPSSFELFLPLIRNQ